MVSNEIVRLALARIMTPPMSARRSVDSARMTRIEQAFFTCQGRAAGWDADRLPATSPEGLAEESGARYVMTWIVATSSSVLRSATTPRNTGSYVSPQPGERI